MDLSMTADYSFLRPLKAPPKVDNPLKVAIVPTPNFTLMSLTCFVEFLRLAADESDFSRPIYCAWDLVSHNQQPVRSSCGFSLMPTQDFSTLRIDEYDHIVIHGGILHGQHEIPVALYEFVQKCAAEKLSIIGLCTGQFVLAELGLLDHKRCAVHFSLSTALQQNFPKVIAVTDMPFVADGGMITCPGGLAAINLAMHLVTTHCGELRTQKALHYLMADRGFDKIQQMWNEPDSGLYCLDQRVVNAVGLMRQKIFEIGSIAEIARGVGTSERELARLFRYHLASSPATYWRNMRLKAARWMLLNSNRSITQIAFECGFSDSAHLVH